MRRLTEDEREALLTEIEERAAIMEHDGKVDRELAERYARREAVDRWSTFPPVPGYEALAAEADMAALIRKARERQKAAVAARK